MKRSYQHISKDSSQRQRYYNDIKKMNYEPTVDKSLEFDRSASPGEDLTEPSTMRKRPINTSQRIRDYISDKWVGLLITLFIGIGGYFLIDAKVSYARLEGDTQNHKTDISEINERIDENVDYNHQQDLEIQQNRTDIEYSQDDISQIEETLQGLILRSYQ